MASFVANGTIPPCRFVKLDTTATGKVLLCGTNGIIYGISKADTRRIPALGLDDGNAAIVGENLHVFEDNEECYLEIVASVTQGQQLKSDTNGKGTPVTANNDIYGAIALQSAPAGKVIKVKVVKGNYFGM